MIQVNFFRKFIAILLAAFLIALIPVVPESAYASSGLPITATSAILLDHQTNRIVYSKTPHKRRAPASTSKVLMAIVVMDRLRLDGIVSVPKFVEAIEPSKVYLKGGERFYVKDLIRAALISSANDAAEALALATAGSRAAFAQLMNKKAKASGCRQSRFMNASGLPAKRQYSTAYDLALIMKAAQKHPFIVKTLKTRRQVIRSLAGRKIYLKNHNKMLWRDKREIVGKTGWTKKAKHCFVGRMKVYGKNVLVSLLGSHRLWKDLKTLVDYQFGVTLYRIRKNRKIWSSHDTKRIQRALKKAGFNPGPIDGIFGALTVGAIERFQGTHYLRVDGITGPQTWRKLKRYL